MPRRSTVAPGFVKGMLAGLRQRGIDPLPMLRAAGIAPETAEGRGPRVPVAQYAQLYNAVVHALGDEAFGLLSSPLRPGAFEFLSRAVLGSRSLGEALDRAARFLAIVLPDLRVSVVREGPAAVLEIRELRRLRARASDPARVFAFEWLLRLLHGLACWLADTSLTLVEVRFPYPRPAHATDYGLVYAERSAFGAEALRAVFAASDLDLPVLRDAADLPAFLAGAPGRISMLYRRDREMARVARALFAQALPRPYALEDAARDMHLSPRTLHRRLAGEGTSFRAIKDALRRELALARLEKSRQSIAGIAADLGYSEPSAFFRAFQGWTGMAPSAWRRRAGPRRRSGRGREVQ
jgi:AraC-like DNA-binding protein